MTFSEQLKADIALIEPALEKYLSRETGEGYDRIFEATKYSAMAGGKRLRPILLMAAADAVGAKGTDYLTTACALEMIHTYSLVHDDLPAMDNDEYRRGRKTTHIVYGEDMGILAGDALLNYAFETACRAFEEESEHALRIGKALKILADKAGIYGMIGGQVVDVQESGKALQAEDQCIDRGFYDGRCSSCRCRGRAGQQDGADRRKDRAGIPDPG